MSNVITAAEWGDPKSKVKKWGDFKRCYESHPPLPIVDHNGHTRFVYGGSCSKPIHDDADVYVRSFISTSC